MSGSDAQDEAALPEGALGRCAGRRGERMHEASVSFEVPFHDVDALQIVWHGHYYKYFELARTALLRSRGLDGRDLLELGFGMIMIESRCRHIAPLRYGDRAQASAWFRDVSHRLCIDYEITRLVCGSRVARGQTVLATVDREGRMLLSTPPAILERLSGGVAGSQGFR